MGPAVFMTGTGTFTFEIGIRKPIETDGKKKKKKKEMEKNGYIFDGGTFLAQNRIRGTQPASGSTARGNSSPLHFTRGLISPVCVCVCGRGESGLGIPPG